MRRFETKSSSFRPGQCTQKQERRGGSPVTKETLTAWPVVVQDSALVAFSQLAMYPSVSRRTQADSRSAGEVVASMAGRAGAR